MDKLSDESDAIPEDTNRDARLATRHLIPHHSQPLSTPRPTQDDGNETSDDDETPDDNETADSNKTADDNENADGNKTIDSDETADETITSESLESAISISRPSAYSISDSTSNHEGSSPPTDIDLSNDLHSINMTTSSDDPMQSPPPTLQQSDELESTV